MACLQARLSHLHPLTRTVRLHVRLFVACIGLYRRGRRLFCSVGHRSGCDVERLRQRAAEDDAGALVIMVLAVVAVAVTNPKSRRAMMLDGALSFIFNATIIALSVNMASNAL